MILYNNYTYQKIIKNKIYLMKVINVYNFLLRLSLFNINNNKNNHECIKRRKKKE